MTNIVPDIAYFLSKFTVWSMKKIWNYKEKNPGNLSRIFLGVALCVVITVISEFQLRTKILPNTPSDSLDNLIQILFLANFYEIFFFVFAITMLLISFLNIFKNKNKLVIVFIFTILLSLVDFVGIISTVQTGKMNSFTVSLLFLTLLLVLYITYQFIIFLRGWVQDEENGESKLNVPKITFLWTVLFALIGLLIKKS